MNREEMLKRLRKGEDPLDLSIQKWRDIVDGKGVDDGMKNCALCEKFNKFEGCYGCPVAEKTGQCFCEGTPYERIGYPISKRLALAELRFLESLKKEPQA